jgi:hypothetical protein
MEVVLMEEITLSDADCVVTSELLQCLLRACKRSLSTSIRDASTENPLPRRPGKPLPRCRVCSRPHEGSPQHLPALRCRFLITQRHISTAVTSATSFVSQQSSSLDTSNFLTFQRSGIIFSMIPAFEVRTLAIEPPRRLGDLCRCCII